MSFGNAHSLETTTTFKTTITSSIMLLHAERLFERKSECIWSQKGGKAMLKEKMMVLKREGRVN